MQSTFAFQHSRAKVAGAAEAAPTATTDTIVWQSKAEVDVNTAARVAAVVREAPSKSTPDLRELPEGP